MFYHMSHISNTKRTLLIYTLAVSMLLVSGQCPWSRELVDLHTDCVCAYSNSQRLSIQCSPVNFTKLILTLQTSVKNIPIDLLYVSNSTIEILRNDSFEDLRIQSLHLSKSKIREVEDGAFRGLEETATSLSLQDNLLRSVPVRAMQGLALLQMLDLSHNVIQRVEDEAFKGLPLNTLKLSDNKLNISDFAFRGLEGTLKNLNLQASGLTTIPRALQRLKVLAYLDLAQNRIENLEAGFLAEMQSLTALSLERNMIRTIDEKAFLGVNATLSSLSLLNNQLAEYPLAAIAMLTEIRVLDLGFNRIATIPIDAFKRNRYLTLLALDGNPLSTLPYEAFKHLNNTLRGLSIGGSTLQCDCRIRWVAEWMLDRDLQVTSRERNPQFCGSPEFLRRRSFQNVLPTDLLCDGDVPTARVPTKRPKRLNSEFDEGPNDVRDDKAVQVVTLDTLVDIANKDSKGVTSPEATVQSGKSSVRKSNGLTQAIRIKNAFKRESTLVLEWEPIAESVLGYQVLIRIFGSRDFKKIMPVARDKRSVQIENLPLSQCLIVCVIPYEDPKNIKVENISSRQCRELKGDDVRTLSLDKIVIAASAVICLIVIVGALVIILFYLRRRDLGSSAASSSTSVRRHGLSVVAHKAAAAPSLKQTPPETDWETLSWNSGRSTPKVVVANGCLAAKAGSVAAGHGFALGDAQLQQQTVVPYKKARSVLNGFCKSYSTHDNESRLSYSHVTKASQHKLDVHRSRSLTRPNGYHPYTGGYIKKKKNRLNGRIASASSSTECESDWNGRSTVWKDNDVDIYVSQNHMVPGSRKYRKEYGVR